MMMKSRIAPTPSGYLHIGNTLSFTLTWLLTQKQGGKLMLRIDDMDGPRIRREYLDDIFETLNFLGIRYDEGPVNTEDFLQHYSQQFRINLYNEWLQTLASTGLVYACTCSRKEIAATTHHNDIACRAQQLSLHTAQAAWRIHVPENTIIRFNDEQQSEVVIDLHAAMPDFVIRRKDGLPAYQLTSLADDLYYGINYVVRGADLLHSTAAQLYLAQCCGNKDFEKCTFLHHPLIKDAHGEKLSKSAGATSIHALKHSGHSAAELLQQIAAALHIHSPGAIQSIDDLLRMF